MNDIEDWPEGQAFDHDMYDGPIPCRDGDWIRLADYKAANARIAELEAKLQTEVSDHAETRKSHARLAKAIKKGLGLDNWPELGHDAVGGMIELLEAKLAAAKKEAGR